MYIHQPVDFVLGIFMFPFGLLGLSRDLYLVFRGTFKNRYEDWRSLSISLWFLSDGPALFFKGFDLRHHESQVTSILEGIALAFLCAILAANGIAYIIRQRQNAKKSMTEVT